MKSNELSSGIKNVAEIVKKADNLELYAMLLDLQSKALELQEENAQLKQQLADRSRIESLRARITRHDQPFITIQDDNNHILYCAHCWDSKEKLIQVNTEPRKATFMCPSCKNEGIYDQDAHNRYVNANKPRGPRITVL